MQSRDAGLAQGGRAVPLHLARLDHDVGSALVPALPVGRADFRAPTRGAPTLWHGRPARDRHGQEGRATVWLRLRRATLAFRLRHFVASGAGRFILTCIMYVDILTVCYCGVMRAEARS